MMGVKMQESYRENVYRGWETSNPMDGAIFVSGAEVGWGRYHTNEEKDQKF